MKHSEMFYSNTREFNKMSFEIKNFTNNDDIDVIQQKGNFIVVEYKKDLSVTPHTAQQEYYAAQMNVRRRQLIAKLQNTGVTLQAGAMQWTVGELKGKKLRREENDKTGIKYQYQGTGMLVTKPTHRHFIVLNLDNWGRAVIVEDGAYLASDSEVEEKAVPYDKLDAEELKNLGLYGTGFVVLDSPVPESELITIDLKEDVLRINGGLAIAWSDTVRVNVERNGLDESGEGLVNVYHGTGRVLMQPAL